MQRLRERELRNPAAHRSDGFTLLEMVIVLATFTLVFIAVLSTFTETSKAVQHGMVSTHMDVSLKRVLQRITDELIDSGADGQGGDHVLSHPPAENTTASSVNFQKRIAFTGEASDWSTPITYRLNPSPGEVAGNEADDDEDGVVDEMQAVRIQDGESTIIADGVTELQVSRSQGAYVMNIQVTVSRRMESGMPPIERVLNTAIALRNRP